jgi:hypothetical protein
MQKLLLLSVLIIFGVSTRSDAQCEGMNGDFENWGILTVQNIGMQEVEIDVPENWLSFNEIFNVIFGAPPNQTLVQSSDAFTGNFALELNVPDGDSAAVNAFALFECDQVFQRLTGYYKLDGDSSLAIVEFAATEFRDSSVLVGLGFVNLEPASEYTKFSLDITYSGDNVSPDSGLVLVNAGSLDGTGVVFTLDNLQLDDTSPIDDFLAEEYGLKLFPNPASNYVSVASNEYYDIVVRVVDASGKLVIQNRIVSPNEPIDISHLGSGTYFIHVEQEKARKLFKMIKP